MFTEHIFFSIIWRRLHYLILGEAGIYIYIYDATAIEKRSFGLKYFS